MAIIAFENLSGNPNLGWTGAAVASIAAAQSADGDRVQTFEVRTLRDAGLRLATSTLEGYLTADGGKLTLRGVVTDADSHKATAVWKIAADDVISLGTAVAKTISGSVVPYTSSNPAAIEAHFRGVTAPELPAAEANLREAVRLDPRYGAAWLALHDLLAQTNRAADARATIPPLQHARLTPIEKARVSVLAAANPRQQSDAIIRLARLRPGDVDLWRQAGDHAMSRRLYREAVTAMDELLKLSPAQEVPLNLRGYALMYLGDFEGASRSFAEYRKRLPDSVNAIDSTAEMMFYFGRYADAARLFMEAHAKNPGNLGGAEPFRAAYSHYMAGNLAEADRLFPMFVNDPKDVRHAIWRHWTGRPAGDAPPALGALWALQAGDRKAAAALAAAARQQAQSPAVANLAGIAAVLSMPSASPDQWNTRMQQMFPAPQQQPVRDQLLGWALLLDGHPREATEYWRRALERTSGQFDNEQRILLAASLLSSGQNAEAKKVMPYGFLPPTNLNASLEVLLYPMAVNLVKKLR